MSNMSWVSLLNAGQPNQTQLGTALSNTTSATDITPGANAGGQAFSFPAGYLQPGLQFRVRASGIISTAATAPTLNLGVYLGGVAGTALATSGAVTTLASLANAIWRLEADLRVDAAGTSGQIRTLATLTGISASPILLPGGGSSSGNSVTVNTSLAQILTVGASWGTASASNSLQVVLFAIEQLN